MKGLSKNRKAGFTLLEVMIALAVVAISLVTLLGLSNRSIGVHDRLQKVTQATLLAQRVMSEIEVRGRETGGILEEEEEFEEPFDSYRWRLSVEETPIPAVRQVTVTVAWGDEARGESVDLTSFMPATGVE